MKSVNKYPNGSCHICLKEFKQTGGGPKITCGDICARVWTNLPRETKLDIKYYFILIGSEDPDVKHNSDGSITDFDGSIAHKPDFKYLKERRDQHILNKNLLGLISSKELRLKYGLSHVFCNPTVYSITKIRKS